MSKIWQPLSREIYQEWVKTILNEAEEKLTNWERDFVDSIDTTLAFTNLSEKQAKILERIYSEKTS